MNHKLQSVELSSADKETTDWYVSIKIVGFEWYHEQSVDLQTRWRKDFPKSITAIKRFSVLVTIEVQVKMSNGVVDYREFKQMLEADVWPEVSCLERNCTDDSFCRELCLYSMPTSSTASFSFSDRSNLSVALNRQIELHSCMVN